MLNTWHSVWWTINTKEEENMKDERKESCSVFLPKDLSFSADYSCYNCKYMNGGSGSQIYCEYYRSYCDPGYCDHFISKY